MPFLNDTDVEVRVRTTSDTKGIDETERGLGRLSGIAHGTGQAALGLTKVLAGAAIAGSALAVVGLNLAGNMEQTEIAFTGILGSGQKAMQFLRDLKSFAALTPFDFPGLATSAKNLLAVRFAAKDVIPMMTTLGNVASTLGVGTDAIAGVVRALGQMQGKGKVAAQELIQISEQIPGFSAIQAIAKDFGITVAQAFKLVEKGGVSADRGIQAILKGMKTFPGAAGAMERQSQTLKGMWETLKDEAGFAADEFIRTSGVFDLVKEGIRAAIPLVKDFGYWMSNTLVPTVKDLAAQKENVTALMVTLGLFAGIAAAAFIAANLSVIGFVAALAGLFLVVRELAKRWNENWGGIQDKTQAVAEFVTVTLPAKVGQAFQAIVDKMFWLKNNWAEVTGWIIGAAMTLPLKLPIIAIQGMLAMGKAIWDNRGAILNAFAWIFDQNKQAWINAWNGMINWLRNVNWGNVARGLANGVIGLVNGAIAGAFAGVPILKDHVPRIPMLANGVRNFGGGLAVVGERGPELVSLPKGANVYSNQDSQRRAPGVTFNQTNHIYNEMDMDVSMREAGFDLSLAI